MKKIILSLVALFAFGWVSAQDSNAIVNSFNEAATALQAKDFAKAAPLFEKVILEGETVEDNTVAGCVAGAKKYIISCYRGLAMKCAMAKDYAGAIENCTTAIAKAEENSDPVNKQKLNMLLAKLYYAQGGDAFNGKDYAKAVEIFSKGYAANPRNTEMALGLATSYFELGEFQNGADICDNICTFPSPKYDEAIAKAKAMKDQYTLYEVARLQQEKNFDGIIALADGILATNPTSALAEKVRLQAYSGKADFAKVIELGENAAAAQVSDEDKSNVYFILGAAYNAKENKAKAIEALRKVTVGPSVDAAKKALADLTK